MMFYIKLSTGALISLYRYKCVLEYRMIQNNDHFCLTNQRQALVTLTASNSR